MNGWSQDSTARKDLRIAMWEVTNESFQLDQVLVTTDAMLTYS